jgi:hypothetical protein
MSMRADLSFPFDVSSVIACLDVSEGPFERHQLAFNRFAKARRCVTDSRHNSKSDRIG